MIANHATGRPLLPHDRLFLSAAARDSVTARRLAAFGERLIGPRAFLAPRNVGRALAVALVGRLQRGAGWRPPAPSHPEMREALQR